MRAVILVAGGSAAAPFTTPDMAARSGLPAGNSLTALRAELLSRGHQVFTLPSTRGLGVADQDREGEGFADLPVLLPADLTINSIDTIDAAGVSAAYALRHIHQVFGVTDIDIVAHSMGGLFSLAAIRQLNQLEIPLAVRSLVTLATPWTGSLAGNLLSGALSFADVRRDQATTEVLHRVREYAVEFPVISGESSHAFLSGSHRNPGWLSRQTGALAGVVVSALGGNFFSAHTDPDILWPHDGLVALASAQGVGIPARLATIAYRRVFPNVHSIFFARALNLMPTQAINWNPEVLDEVARLIDNPPGQIEQ